MTDLIFFLPVLTFKSVGIWMILTLLSMTYQSGENRVKS